MKEQVEIENVRIDFLFHVIEQEAAVDKHGVCFNYIWQESNPQSSL